jgi:hypothetical protein
LLAVFQVYLVISGAAQMSRFASSESGSIRVKSENSKPGATEQPTRTVSDIGSAACQVPAGITWQKQFLPADKVMHIGGMFAPSQVYKFSPGPW